jgi:hypothetical protein
MNHRGDMMKIKFQHLLRENYYKTLSTILLAIGFSVSSYFGIYLKNSIFGENMSGISFNLCLAYLILGIILLILAVYCGYKVDEAKGVKKK